MRTFSCSPTFSDLTDVGVFFAMRPKDNTTICGVNRISVSGSLGSNKSIGISLDLVRKLDLTNAVQITSTVEYDENDLSSNVQIVTFQIPPVITGGDYIGRARSARSFWCNNTTESAAVVWDFGMGALAKSIVLRGQSRWLCLVSSDIPQTGYAGSVVYPSVEWVEGVQ